TNAVRGSFVSLAFRRLAGALTRANACPKSDDVRASDSRREFIEQISVRFRTRISAPRPRSSEQASMQEGSEKVSRPQKNPSRVPALPLIPSGWGTKLAKTPSVDLFRFWHV